MRNEKDEGWKYDFDASDCKIAEGDRVYARNINCSLSWSQVVGYQVVGYQVKW